MEDKIAVVYAAAGPVGSALAAAFARAGATVHLTGRHLDKLHAVAKAITAEGGKAHVAQVDAGDEQAVVAHMDGIIAMSGTIDISVNTIGIPQQGIQGIPLLQLPVEHFMLPAQTYLRSHFITARAAARHMTVQGSGVIMLHTPEPARVAAPLVGGMGPVWAALEGISRSFSAEWGSSGVRSIVLRSTGLPETHTIDIVFEAHARAAGMTREQFQALMESMTHRKKLTSLAELASVAVFMASDGAAAMTGAVVNLTGGVIVD